MRLFAITLTFLTAATFAAVVKADDTSKRSAELQVIELFVGTWDVKFVNEPTEFRERVRSCCRGRKWN